MKNILIIAILIMFSCSEEAPEPQMGCITGVSKSDPSGERVSMGCRTREQFLAGDNVSAGGVSYFGNYTQHQWKAVSDCDKCK
jgi:hypothetical protein